MVGEQLKETSGLDQVAFRMSWRKVALELMLDSVRRDLQAKYSTGHPQTHAKATELRSWNLCTQNQH